MASAITPPPIHGCAHSGVGSSCNRGTDGNLARCIPPQAGSHLPHQQHTSAPASPSTGHTQFSDNSWNLLIGLLQHKTRGPAAATAAAAPPSSHSANATTWSSACARQIDAGYCYDNKLCHHQRLWAMTAWALSCWYQEGPRLVRSMVAAAASGGTPATTAVPMASKPHSCAYMCASKQTALSTKCRSCMHVPNSRHVARLVVRLANRWHARKVNNLHGKPAMGLCVSMGTIHRQQLGGQSQGQVTSRCCLLVRLQTPPPSHKRAGTL